MEKSSRMTWDCGAIMSRSRSLKLKKQEPQAQKQEPQVQKQEPQVQKQEPQAQKREIAPDPAFKALDKTVEQGGLVPGTLEPFHREENRLKSKLAQATDPQRVKDLSTLRESNRTEFLAEQKNVDQKIKEHPDLRSKFKTYADARGIPQAQKKEINRESPGQQPNLNQNDIALLRKEVSQLKEKVEKLEALNTQLNQANAPKGLRKGLGKLSQSVGERMNSMAAAVTNATRPLIDKANQAVTQAEAGTVFKSVSSLTKQYGKPQKDGSKKSKCGCEI